MMQLFIRSLVIWSPLLTINGFLTQNYPVGTVPFYLFAGFSQAVYALLSFGLIQQTCREYIFCTIQVHHFENHSLRKYATLNIDPF